MLKAPYLWHPIFVHFNVALLSVATGFYVLATLFKQSRFRAQWLTVAHWNFALGLAMTLFTILFGWVAFTTVNHEAAAHETMILHRNLALVTAGGFGTLGLLALWQRSRAYYPAWWFTALLAVCFGFLIATGLRGGELVYRYGVAVQAPPKPLEDTSGRHTDDGHRHDGHRH